MNLAGKNIVVFDLEIKNIIGQNGVTWDTHDKMGISVGCLFDFRTMDNFVYLDDNLSALTSRLNSADLVVGFNIEKFDLPLLAATSENKICLRQDLQVYDILYYSRLSLGWRPLDPFPKGLNLDNHLLATFGQAEMKTANGEEAPKMYQAGKIGDLITYCLADVRREAKLFKHICHNGKVSTPMHGERRIQIPTLLSVPKPPEDVL